MGKYIDQIIMFLLWVIFAPIAYTLKVLFYIFSTIKKIFYMADKKINKH